MEELAIISLEACDGDRDADCSGDKDGDWIDGDKYWDDGDDLNCESDGVADCSGKNDEDCDDKERNGDWSDDDGDKYWDDVWNCDSDEVADCNGGNNEDGKGGNDVDMDTVWDGGDDDDGHQHTHVDISDMETWPFSGKFEGGHLPSENEKYFNWYNNVFQKCSIFQYNKTLTAIACKIK